ncbi:MAG: hypothetical protein V1720_14855 [bacterium]
MKNIRIVIFIFALTIISTKLFAGGIIKINDTEHRTGVVNTTTVYLSTDFIRIDILSKGKESILIYNSTKDILWSIDKQANSYMEITGEDVDKMKSMFGDMEKNTEEVLKKLTEQQRAELEKKLARKNKTESKIEVKKTASGQKIDKWICDKFESDTDSVRTAEIWATNWNNSGLQSDYRGTLSKMLNFLKKFNGRIIKNAGLNNLEYIGENSLPIKSISYSKNVARITSEVKEIIVQEIQANTFELPQGVTKKELPIRQL